ncbi:cytochrome c [Comamonas sp. GB3 AK4-5]|uniref:cytochrome c n=1 Tax=Comamonas sp. GB3 AK4-5 TaxID=3231487 RepID=UPI00351E6225
MKTAKKIIYGGLGLAALLAGGFFAVTHHAEIAPRAAIDVQEFSPALIDQGKLLVTMGDCAICHTAKGGAENAGGFPMPSPFGLIYSTNITPDPETGIGKWSYEAFERAMRHGIDREGRNLYPAFPYTAFTRVTDEDMHAIYAYLMSQPAVKNQAPKTDLGFPFNIRQGVALWNWKYLTPGPVAPDASQTPEWNRGVYIAEGLGHCSACHSPRDQFAGEKKGMFHLAGGSVEGWDAPALTSATAAPLPWTHEDLLTYFRTGISERHGVAAGPMAPVAHGLAQLGESDLQALTTYIMSYKDAKAEPGDAQALVQKTNDTLRVPADAEGLRLYQGACMSCHSSDPKSLLADTTFGSRPQLALNTNMHADSPTNAVLVMLEGIQSPAHPELGTMPSFRYTLSDAQIATLLNTMRAQYGLPEWQNLQPAVAKLRAETDPAKALH